LESLEKKKTYIGNFFPPKKGLYTCIRLGKALAAKQCVKKEKKKKKDQE